MSSEEIKQKIKSKINGPTKEDYVNNAEEVLVKNADGEFKNLIYGKMEPTLLLDYMKINELIRDKIERKENESKFEASKMLVKHVFSLENGFFDLLNALVSIGQIRVANKIMDKIERIQSHNGSVPSSQLTGKSLSGDIMN